MRSQAAVNRKCRPSSGMPLLLPAAPRRPNVVCPRCEHTHKNWQCVVQSKSCFCICTSRLNSYLVLWPELGLVFSNIYSYCWVDLKCWFRWRYSVVIEQHCHRKLRYNKTSVEHQSQSIELLIHMNAGYYFTQHTTGNSNPEPNGNHNQNPNRIFHNKAALHFHQYKHKSIVSSRTECQSVLCEKSHVRYLWLIGSSKQEAVTSWRTARTVFKTSGSRHTASKRSCMVIHLTCCWSALHFKLATARQHTHSAVVGGDAPL